MHDLKAKSKARETARLKKYAGGGACGMSNHRRKFAFGGAVGGDPFSAAAGDAGLGGDPIGDLGMLEGEDFNAPDLSRSKPKANNISITLNVAPPAGGPPPMPPPPPMPMAGPPGPPPGGPPPGAGGPPGALPGSAGMPGALPLPMRNAGGRVTRADGGQVKDESRDKGGTKTKGQPGSHSGEGIKNEKFDPGSPSGKPRSNPISGYLEGRGNAGEGFGGMPDVNTLSASGLTPEAALEAPPAHLIGNGGPAMLERSMGSALSPEEQAAILNGAAVGAAGPAMGGGLEMIPEMFGAAPTAGAMEALKGLGAPTSAERDMMMGRKDGGRVSGTSYMPGVRCGNKKNY
jgi:hypothetical protein